MGDVLRGFFKVVLCLIVCFGGAYVLHQLYLAIPDMKFTVAFLGGAVVLILAGLVLRN